MGVFQIHHFGTPDYSAYNVNFAYGDWDAATDSLQSGSEVTLKLGMYNWDTENYTTDESRTMYIDSVHTLMDNSMSDAASFATVNSTGVPEPSFIAFGLIVGTLGLSRHRQGT